MYYDAVSHRPARRARSGPTPGSTVSTTHSRTNAPTVSGHLVLKDPQAKDAKMSQPSSGFSAYPAYTIQPAGRGGAPGSRAQSTGRPMPSITSSGLARTNRGSFHLNAVRPGNYTLHALRMASWENLPRLTSR